LTACAALSRVGRWRALEWRTFVLLSMADITRLQVARPDERVGNACSDGRVSGRSNGVCRDFWSVAAYRAYLGPNWQLEI
jgi:hypothetical protein